MVGKSLMFSFVGKKRPNPIGGHCYDCEYCYIHGKKGMKIRFKHIRDKYSGDFKLYPKILEKLRNIRSEKPIFVCDCIDCMHEDNSKENILDLFWHIKNSRYNITVILLTKNPSRFNELIEYIPDNVILGVTIESNIDYPDISKAPLQSERIKQLLILRENLDKRKMKNKIFISIEPIMNFDLIPFLRAIFNIGATFGVAIGYDNHHNKLCEPSLRKTMALRNNLKIRGINVYDKT